jgi:hypothetical protein
MASTTRATQPTKSQPGGMSGCAAARQVSFRVLDCRDSDWVSVSGALVRCHARRSYRSWRQQGCLRSVARMATLGWLLSFEFNDRVQVVSGRGRLTVEGGS